MANYFEKRGKFQQEREKYYRDKTNTRLKYAALIFNRCFYNTFLKFKANAGLFLKSSNYEANRSYFFFSIEHKSEHNSAPTHFRSLCHTPVFIPLCSNFVFKL